MPIVLDIEKNKKTRSRRHHSQHGATSEYQQSQIFHQSYTLSLDISIQLLIFSNSTSLGRISTPEFNSLKDVHATCSTKLPSENLSTNARLKYIVSGRMDISLFKLDIDEILNDYAQNGFTTLADMKGLWKARKFSYIYEASPTTHVGLFMQSLYGHTLGRMIFGATLSHRLAGLYCLYCLYETQPFKPPFKVYISLGNLKHLKNLIVDANQSGVIVVSHLAKRMLNNNMFLIGLVDINETSTLEKVNELTRLHNVQTRIAYNKLFENSEIERFLEFDMDTELGIDEIKKLTTEYASSKKIAVGEASQVVDVQNIEHIAENKNHIGEVMEHITTKWKEQKELFHQQTSLDQLQISQDNLRLPIKPASEPDQLQQEEDDDDDDDEFDQELQRLLSIPE